MSYKALTDLELIFFLKEGDESAFEEIYNRYWDKLYYTAHRNLKSAEAAEEIIQQVFMKIWSKRETLTINCLSAYLAAMVRYAVYRYLASEKQIKLNTSAYQLDHSEFISVDGLIENKLMLEIITELSNKLPEKCRLVFQYNKLQDKSLAEVADILNISQKTAEAHLTKALKIIRGNA